MQTILLIENNGDILSNLTVYLEIEGYNVIAVNTAKKGIEIAEESMPDLIICDVLIPEMDGYEVLSILKESSRASIIPFILSASESEKIDKVKAGKLGADGYLVKPFDIEALSNLVRSQIRRALSLTLHI